MASISAPRPYAPNASTAKSSQAAQSHPFTCNSCQVAFRNGDLQRTHMRTDWHRYNLKRRVASLPPISAETFNDKVLSAQASSNAVAAKATFEKVCTACQKSYYSQNSFDNHLKGHRHRTAVAILARDGSVTDTGSIISSTISLGEPINGRADSGVITPKQSSLPIESEAEAEFSDVVNALKEAKLTQDTVSSRPSRPHHSSSGFRAEHPLSPDQVASSEDDIQRAGRNVDAEDNLTRCLFCQINAGSLEDNFGHMTKVHGLFIPEKPYLVDVEGLMKWLWQQVNEEPHQCLYCHKIKPSAEGIRGHMRDTGHCKIAFEEEEEMIEVGQFYDFSSTYSDDEDSGDSDDDEAGAKQNAREHEDGWEDDSDVDSDDVEDEVQLDRSKQAIISKSRRELDPSSQGFVVDEELYLPSGRIAGHRSLKKYFRQNLHNRPTPTERVEQQRQLTGTESSGLDDEAERKRQRGRQLVSRANGGIGMLGVDDAKKREIKLVEKHDTKRAQRAERQYEWGVQKRANNQRHFRDPLLQ